MQQKYFALQKILIFLLFLMVSPGIASAQIVNIESKRLDIDSNGIAGFIGVSFNITYNTKQILQLGGQSQLLIRRSRNRFFILNDISVVRAQGENFINNGYQHLRYNRDFTNWLVGEVFLQAQYNQVRKLKFRSLAGGGPRFKLLATDSARLNYGIAYMYEYQEFTDETTYLRAHRISSYLSATFIPSPNLRIQHITYFQPSVTKPLYFNDFRISTQTEITFVVVRNLTFSVAFDLLYDSQPPPDVTEISYSLINRLGYRF